MAKPPHDGCIGDVPTIPREQYIQAVSVGEGNVRGVAISGGRKESGLKNLVGQRFSGGRQVQHSDASHEFDTALRHDAFSSGDFVENNLGGEKFVLLALQIPPVAGELLARGLDEVTRGTRHDVAWYRALDADAHGRSLRLSLFDGSKNVGDRSGCFPGAAAQPASLSADRPCAAAAVSLRPNSHACVPQLWPRHAGVLLQQSGFELWIAVRSERGPIEGGFQPFAVGRAEPELNRQVAFADMRMCLQREALV